MSAYTTNTKIKLQNKTSMMEVDLHGGAITDFHLLDNPVNPLSFRFSKEQMPANNKASAVYQGHFICAGRWGEPSAGEINAGIPNHGEPANIEWNIVENNDHMLRMETTASLEGLHLHRNMQLSKDIAVCHVAETITNITPLGRLYQLVQHPTIAAPFLNETTVVDCNATIGFDYKYADNPSQKAVNWPYIKSEDQNIVDLRNPQQACGSVFSFVVNKTDEYGWLTAYSPEYELLTGYIWPRKDYPWISLWQHFENDVIKYRGLEFGNTGLHQPFKNIIANNQLELFGEKTVSWIDAGETVTREYVSFLYQVDKAFKGVDKLMIKDKMLCFTENITGTQINIGNVQFNNSHHE